MSLSVELNRGRKIGHSCIKGVFLDELDPNHVRIDLEVIEDCGIAYQLFTRDAFKKINKGEKKYD